MPILPILCVRENPPKKADNLLLACLFLLQSYQLWMVNLEAVSAWWSLLSVFCSVENKFINENDHLKVQSHQYLSSH